MFFENFMKGLVYDIFGDLFWRVFFLSFMVKSGLYLLWKIDDINLIVYLLDNKMNLFV